MQRICFATSKHLSIVATTAATLTIMAATANAQEAPLPEGSPLPYYSATPPTFDPFASVEQLDISTNGLPTIMLVGFWPPTNEMIRTFSNSTTQNPDGWTGENWESRGYNIYSLFPEFPDGLGKGVGDFEVDYQDTSADWWYYVDQLNPIAIIVFGRSGWDYDWELEGGHRMYGLSSWSADYLDPTRPTPELPIANETVGNERMSTLPMVDIINRVEAQLPSLEPYSTTIDSSKFVCNFTGYHANWYHDDHATPGDSAWNASAGLIHVGYRMSLNNAISATMITLRAMTDHLDAIIPSGDYNHDGMLTTDDFDYFPSCLTGPNETFTKPACRIFDTNADADIDLRDFATLQSRLSLSTS